MNNLNGIVATVARKEQIAQAAPARHTALRQAAEALSRRTVDAATTELLNEALARLTQLCYERGEDGQLCNVDPATGKVLVPLPWGKAGHRKWGLSPSEADVMRCVMFARQRQGLPLFHFDRSRRAWFLNIQSFSEASVVLGQLREWEISVGEYQKARGQGGR